MPYLDSFFRIKSHYTLAILSQLTLNVKLFFKINPFFILIKKNAILLPPKELTSKTALFITEPKNKANRFWSFPLAIGFVLYF